jgi:DNA-binding transcriptional LysR family regulator
MSDPFGLASIFLACADAGGFSAAGRKLGLSRSAVGKAVARLEAQLGVQLFRRTTRSQSLTEDGHVYYERAQRALAELEAARAALDLNRREPSGSLKVTAPVLFGRRYVAPPLFSLAAAHPNLKLTIAFTDRPVDLVEEGFDLAVRIGRLPDTAGLMSRRLSGEQMTICAAPSYLARRGTPQTRADLADHDLLIYGRTDTTRQWRLPNGQGGFEEITAAGRIRLDDLEALADAAARGMGLAWLPCWLVADRLTGGELVPVLPELPQLTFDIYAVWPQAAAMPMRLRAALDLLAVELPASRFNPRKGYDVSDQP